MRLRKLATGLAAGSLLACSATAVNAALIDAWKLNLSLTNGLVLSDGSTISLAQDAANIDHVVLDGRSTVNQTLVGGSGAGQPFTDNGFLQFLATVPEGGIATNLFFGIATGIPVVGNHLVDGFIEFKNLTGTLDGAGNITFNPGSGSIDFYVENDGDANSSTGGVAKLYSLQIIAPSGGSNLDFLGGANPDGHIAVTTLFTSGLFPNLFETSAGVDLTTFVLHLFNVNSLLDPNPVFAPNPNITVDGSGNGNAIIHVMNAGQYNLATFVPEPDSLLLMGIGLTGLGFGAARRRKNTSS